MVRGQAWAAGCGAASTDQFGRLQLQAVEPATFLSSAAPHTALNLCLSSAAAHTALNLCLSSTAPHTALNLCLDAKYQGASTYE